MTTHPDTCPMREGDSQRRSFVHFVGGPLDGLDAWIAPPLGQAIRVGPPVFWGLRLYRAHLYRVTDAHRVEHMGAL